MCLSAGSFQTRSWKLATAFCNSSCPHSVHPSQRVCHKNLWISGYERYHVVKCSGMQEKVAHPLWMCCHCGLCCPCCCWAGPGRRQPLHSMSRCLAMGNASVLNSLGSSFPHTAARHVPAPLPKHLCPFFVVCSFYLPALIPALKICPPGAENEFFKWKQQI